MRGGADSYRVSSKAARPVSVWLTEVRLGCFGSATGWATFYIKVQNKSLRFLWKGCLTRGPMPGCGVHSRPKSAERKLDITAYLE